MYLKCRLHSFWSGYFLSLLWCSWVASSAKPHLNLCSSLLWRRKVAQLEKQWPCDRKTNCTQLQPSATFLTFWGLCGTVLTMTLTNITLSSKTSFCYSPKYNNVRLTPVLIWSSGEWGAWCKRSLSLTSWCELKRLGGDPGGDFSTTDWSRCLNVPLLVLVCPFILSSDF